tara:strand:+ start:908 stop:1051 length:144 start_codon:yes stop_codon:yes gene_type:complete
MEGYFSLRNKEGRGGEGEGRGRKRKGNRLRGNFSYSPIIQYKEMTRY